MRPATEVELSEMIRATAGPVTVRGGGTRRIGPVAGAVLETGGLAGVQLYEPGALTLVVRAGTALAEVEALLAVERQRLAFEVPDLRGLLGRTGASTIGGVVAANASGPRRVQAGACRDSLLGLRFVDGTGAIVKNGGRVMKNVTGYDLVKLMAGSRGALGVLTEVALRVQAVPEAEVTLLSPRAIGPGLEALRKALGSPYEVSGAGYAGGQALLRIEGMAGSVAYRAAMLKARLGGDWDELSGAESSALWARLRDVTPFAGREGSVWRMVVKPTEAERIAAGCGGETLIDWGGGVIWALTAGGQSGVVRSAVGRDGHATLVRASVGDGFGEALPTEPSAVAALTAALRLRFDPRGIFQTGGQA
ncbi:MAG: FAD-binding protein [Pseudorhodobacter sp.]|nr:MAG: FAD-binding protein [Pseudorhodobacter sp.]